MQFSKKIPPTPKEMPYFSGLQIFILLFSLLLLSKDIYFGIKISFWIDLFLVFSNLGFIYLRFRDAKKTNEKLKILKKFENISDPPRMTEVGHSMILNYIAPSNQLMRQLQKIVEETNPKKKKQ